MTNPQNQTPSYRLNMTYLLIGAGLGLYYGITYRGVVSEPEYVRVLIWSFIAALVTVIIRSIKSKPGIKAFLLDLLKMFLLYGTFLMALEFRKQIEIWGGKASVIVFTTSIGALVGIILGLQKKPTKPNLPTTTRGG